MSQRLVYIDCLRGVAILMVVYSHILSFSMGGIEPSPIGLWMRNVMLPLFFFISGICAWKDNSQTRLGEYWKSLKSKIVKILIPTVVMFLAFNIITGNDALFYALRYDKCGYWFTWVLFQIFIIYITFNWLGSFSRNLYVRLCIILSPIVIMAVIFHFTGLESQAAVFFEWVKVKLYYSYFICGVLVRCFDKYVFKVLSLKLVNCGLFVIALLPFCRSLNLENLRGGGIYLIISVLMLYYMFANSKINLQNGNSFLSRQLVLIGKNTLAIYFLHFFILFRIPIIPQWLESLKSDMCFGSNSCSSFVEFFIVMAIALLLSYACIFIKRVLIFFPYISLLCLGETKKASQ